jgi:purine-cytosine permease-like protein
MLKKNKILRLTDLNQSWWQLAAIQLTGVTSLPIITSSIILIKNNNFMSSIITLIIANILLWIIRLLIVNLSYKDRKSSIDISLEYFGKLGTYFIAILLLLSTFAEFVMQNTLASNALSYLTKIEANLGVNRFIQISVLIGILSTLFCMNGIKIIKWISIVFIPILFFSIIGILFTSDLKFPTGTIKDFSLSGLPLILTINLAVTIDIPTFFRHSKSKKDSINAIAAIQIISFLIGVAGLFLSTLIAPWFGLNTDNTILTNGFYLKSFLIIFIFISAISANITNVYSSSVGWELLAPILAGKKEYLILGLSLTLGFILIANIISLEILANLTDYALINLAFTIITAYTFFLRTKRKPFLYEKLSYFAAWVISIIFNFLQIYGIILKTISPLITGFVLVISIISLLMIIKPLIKKVRVNEK